MQPNGFDRTKNHTGTVKVGGMIVSLLYWLFLIVVLMPWGRLLAVMALQTDKYYEKESGLALQFPLFFAVLHTLLGLIFCSFLANLLSCFHLLLPYFFLPIFSILSVILWWVDVGQIRSLALKAILDTRIGWAEALLLAITTLMFAIKSVSFPEVFDDGSYGIPLIKLYSELGGPIKGFANLNAHFGLNSSWHSLHAALGLFIGHGVEYVRIYVLNGFLAFLWLITAIQFLSVSRKNGIATSTAIIPAILLPLIFRNQLTSVSTDVPAILGIWWILLFLLLASEIPESEALYGKVAVFLTAFLCTVKLTTWVLLIWPIGYWVISNKHFSSSWWYMTLFIGIIIILPWLYQNFIISGYLIFPLQFSGIFKPLWQVPAVAIEEKFYVSQFGIYAFPKNPDFNWLRAWWQAHPQAMRFLIVLAVISTLYRLWLSSINNNHTARNSLHMLVNITGMAGIITWWLTVSEPRYGFGYIAFMSAMAVAPVILKFRHLYSYPALMILLIGAQMFNLSKTIKEYNYGSTDILFAIRPTPATIVKTTKCGNFEAYTPIAYQDSTISKPPFCWDCPIPCLPNEELGDSAWVFQLGKHVKSGFYSIQPPR